MSQQVRSSPRVRRRRIPAEGHVVMEIIKTFPRLETFGGDMEAVREAACNIRAYCYYIPILDVCLDDLSVQAKSIPPPPDVGYEFAGFFDKPEIGLDEIHWPFRCSAPHRGFWMAVAIHPLAAWINLPRGSCTDYNVRYPVRPEMIHWPSKNVLCTDGTIRHYTDVPEYEIIMEMHCLIFVNFLKTPDAEMTEYPYWYPASACAKLFLGQILGIHPSNEYYDRDPRRVQAFEEAMDSLYGRT